MSDRLLDGRFKYDTVVMTGDNLLGSERPQDLKLKFEIPSQLTGPC